MKLINAVDLKEYAQQLLVGESINTYFGINLYKMFEEIIDHAPTVEVLENNERPHGEWAFDEKGYFYCDKCGKYPHDQYATIDFCPNCGAEMG